MTSQLKWFYDNIYYKNDPRTSEWFLISRPELLIGIISLYIYFCVSAGPRYMSNRAPYSLRTTLIIYNFIQVLLSIYLVYEALMAGWLFEYSYTCQPVDYSESPLAIRMARAVHSYFICKIIELLDTVFFVLRKKNHQISVLHLYHHTSMPLISWLAVRYVGGGHMTFLGLINSFVHMFMYYYYMLAAMGSRSQKFIWWKKYMTMLQMFQFFIVGLHSVQMLFTDCNFPKAWSVFIVIDCAAFLYMFGSFYVRNHVKSNSNSVKVDGALTDSRSSLKSD